MNRNEGNEMLIVGQVSSEEEKYEVNFVAQVWVLSQRIRYLARSQNNKRN